MAIQGESQESTFYCLINLVQDVSEPFFFVRYSTGCISFSASYKLPFIYHIPGLKRHLSHSWHQREREERRAWGKTNVVLCPKY